MLQQLTQRYGHHPRVHVIRSSSGSDRQLGLTFFQQHSTWQTELYPAGPLEISAASLRPQSSSSGSWKKGTLIYKLYQVFRVFSNPIPLSQTKGQCWKIEVVCQNTMESSIAEWLEFLTHSGWSSLDSHLYYTLTVALCIFVCSVWGIFSCYLRLFAAFWTLDFLLAKVRSILEPAFAQRYLHHLYGKLESLICVVFVASVRHFGAKICNLHGFCSMLKNESPHCYSVVFYLVDSTITAA